MTHFKFATFAYIGLSAACLAAQDNWCSTNSWHSDGMVNHAEVREEHLAAAGQNVIHPEQNGSIRVHGWRNSDIQVKACVRTSASDAAAAESLAKQVTITDGPGRVVAKGPSSERHSSWSVSYEVWVPESAALELRTTNGSITIEDTAGHVSANTQNGSIKAKAAKGDFAGETTNGSVQVDLSNGWSGKEVKLNTVNGSIQVHMPANVSADVEASTVNGRVRSDFPTSATDDKSHHVKFTIGSGGPVVAARAVNGSIQIARQN